MTDEAYTPVELSPEKLKKLEKLATDFPGLMEYPHHAGSMPVVPTEEGMVKARSLQAMEEQTYSTMGILADFMKLAMKHAAQVKERVEISKDIYNAKISFEPLIGQEYFLYERECGEKVLSLVTPTEWGDTIPFRRSVAQVRLLADHTWEVLEKF